MAKALRGEAVVHLPRTSNNAGHESLRLAQRVKSFQAVLQILNITNCILPEEAHIYDNTLIFLFFNQLLKRFHAIFGIRS